MLGVSAFGVEPQEASGGARALGTFNLDRRTNYHQLMLPCSHSLCSFHEPKYSANSAKSQADQPEIKQRMAPLIVSSAVILPGRLALLLTPHHGALPGFSFAVRLVDVPPVSLEATRGCKPLWLGAKVTEMWLGVVQGVPPVHSHSQAQRLCTVGWMLKRTSGHIFFGISCRRSRRGREAVARGLECC